MLVRNSNDKDLGALLELLANEGRRRILELLTKKPCYISEISYSLRMAPKVVLEHLEKLERAGIVRSYEDGRRRYYYIDRTISISITLSPHRFKIESVERSGDMSEVFRDLREMFEQSINQNSRDLFEKLSKMEKAFRDIQRDISDRIDELIDRMILKIDETLTEDLEKIVLYGLIKGLDTPEKISRIFGIPHEEVIAVLNSLEKRGLVARMEDDGVIRFIPTFGGVVNE
ncbi:ArsR family transcriptional regulator [Geoglobus acetivorans]|uniref:ArsR family transcriptional regulator n=1 Tax=Geoglobus acetivorans TaxID=565033 RepID=UPI00064ED454